VVIEHGHRRMTPSPPVESPNVVVFLTDQQRWDTTGIHGNPLELTPNLDRAAGRGTHLSNFFTCQPVCLPARASLQTGLYGTETDCWNNRCVLPLEQPTLGSLFRDAGYDTGYLGKWHLAGTVGAVPPERRGGYEHWLASNLLEFTSEPYRTVLYDEDGAPVALPGYRSDALVDAAIRWIAQPRERPFFLFLSPLEPHQQNHTDDFPAPHGYRERYEGRWTPSDLAALGGTTYQHLGGYCGMVKRIDEGFGRLLDALESLALTESTIVLFTSDHGCHFKTRNAEYKRSAHESSIRVPAVFQGPGFDLGRRVEQLVSLIDLPPTLLDAAGLAVPESMQGRSLRPLLRGETDEWRDDVFVQISESQIGRALRTDRWKYSVTAESASGWDAPAADVYTEDLLYDLDSDPHELVNLIGLDSHRPVADDLRARLLRRIAEAGESAPTIALAPERPAAGRAIDLDDAVARLPSTAMPNGHGLG
jgi:arylsulfatase A-like enzyme